MLLAVCCPITSVADMQMADMKNQTQSFLENLIQLKTLEGFDQIGRLWKERRRNSFERLLFYYIRGGALYVMECCFFLPNKIGIIFRICCQNFVFRICGKNISELVFGIFSKCYANTRSLTTAAKLSSSMKAEFVKTRIVGLWMKMKIVKSSTAVRGSSRNNGIRDACSTADITDCRWVA